MHWLIKLLLLGVQPNLSGHPMETCSYWCYINHHVIIGYAHQTHWLSHEITAACHFSDHYTSLQPAQLAAIVTLLSLPCSLIYLHAWIHAYSVTLAWIPHPAGPAFSEWLDHKGLHLLGLVKGVYDICVHVLGKQCYSLYSAHRIASCIKQHCVDYQALLWWRK